jgi:hypothetical protein
MDALTLEDVVRKFDLRFDRMEQFLPTLVTRAELEGMQLATKAELQAGLQSVKDELRAELASKAELRTEIRAESVETRHYMKMLIEDVRGDIRLVIESLEAAEARNAREHEELRLTDARLDARVTAIEAGRRQRRSR